MIVTAGKNFVRDLITNKAPGSITWMDIGDDATAPAVGQTALIGTVYGEGSLTESEPDSVSVRFQMDVASGEGNGGGTMVYKEVGLLIADNSTMLCRQIYTNTTKDVSIAFKVQVVVDVTS